MTKRLIDIDDHLLESAQLVLDTSTYKDTVNEALESVVHRPRRRQDTRALLERFAEATVDLRDPEVMKGAWH